MNEVKLEITMNMENGQVSVSGPIDNLAVCLLLLEAGRDAIKNRLRQQPPSGIVKGIALPGNLMGPNAR